MRSAAAPLSSASRSRASGRSKPAAGFRHKQTDLIYRLRSRWTVRGTVVALSAMLLAYRPDLLPIDHKRQGRAEVHIPLFYPDNEQEISEMFRVMTRKNDAECQLDDRTKVTTDDIERSLDEFIPSAQPFKKTLQELAAVLECTHRDFPNDHWRNLAEAPEGRPQLQQRLTRTRAMVKIL